MTSLRCLGVDYGTKRIGLATGDELGVASPQPAILEEDQGRQITRLADVIRVRRIQQIVIGYPYNMDGSAGFKAKEVDAFLEKLRTVVPGVPVERVDERLTSRVASAHLNLRQERAQRASGRIDSAAAALILQDYLDRKFPPQLDWLQNDGEHG